MEAEAVGGMEPPFQEILKVLGLLMATSVNHMANRKFAGAIS